MQEKYNVVLSGRSPGLDPHEMALKLAALFKCTQEQAAHLLSQTAHIVKKDVTGEIAAKYKQAIEKTGAQCIIQPVEQEAPLDFDIAPAAAAYEQPVPIASRPAPRVNQSPAVATSAIDPPVLTAAIPPVAGERPATAHTLTRQEAIKIFVGNNHDYFERKWAETAQKKQQLSWSWAACLVGFGWMGFRKMYLYSWIFIGVVTAEVIAELAIGVPSAISSSINLGIAIAFGLKGNVWYQQHVHQRVDQILASYSPYQARIELVRQGGTNIGAAIGFVVGLFVLLMMIAVIAEA